MFPSPVLLADKQIEGVLCPQEVVVVQDLDGTHPVRIEVTCNLPRGTKRQKHEAHWIKQKNNRDVGQKLGWFLSSK